MPETRQVILLREESTIVLTLGSATALVNGQAMELPGGVPAGVVKWEGRESTMVPLRFVSEQLGATVDWDNDTFTAILTSPAPRSRSPRRHRRRPRAHARHARRRRQGVCHRHLGGRLFPRGDHRHRPYRNTGWWIWETG
ncbi:MAG: copper amine oxidase N-terminal domain-containing protein [Flavonifractor plautii]